MAGEGDGELLNWLTADLCRTSCTVYNVRVPDQIFMNIVRAV